MGVKGLWQLIAPTAKPISLDSLDGKVLAVDVAIWLNKAAKGMRDQNGHQIYNAHLVLMFHRICKLLFYGVKPIIVFDGGVPDLKKQTLRARRDRRLSAELRAQKANEAIITKFLQTKALETITGTKSQIKLKLGEKKNEPDLFELPAITTSQSESSEEDDVMDEWTLHSQMTREMVESSGNVDIHSDEFNLLPPEVKYEVLLTLQETERKRRKRKYKEGNTMSSESHDKSTLPEEASSFSEFQLKNLKTRGLITHQLDQLKKEMSDTLSSDYLDRFDDKRFDPSKSTIESSKIRSDGRKRILFIKHRKSKEANSLFSSNLDDAYARFKKREQSSTEQFFRKLERVPAKFEAINTDDPSVKGYLKQVSDESSDEENVNTTSVETDMLRQSDPNIEVCGVENLSDNSSSDENVDWVDVKDDDCMVVNERSSVPHGKIAKLQSILVSDDEKLTESDTDNIYSNSSLSEREFVSGAGSSLDSDVVNVKSYGKQKDASVVLLEKSDASIVTIGDSLSEDQNLDNDSIIIIENPPKDTSMISKHDLSLSNNNNNSLSNESDARLEASDSCMQAKNDCHLGDQNVDEIFKQTPSAEVELTGKCSDVTDIDLDRPGDMIQVEEVLDEREKNFGMEVDVSLKDQDTCILNIGNEQAINEKFDLDQVEEIKNSENVVSSNVIDVDDGEENSVKTSTAMEDEIGSNFAMCDKDLSEVNLADHKMELDNNENIEANVVSDSDQVLLSSSSEMQSMDLNSQVNEIDVNKSAHRNKESPSDDDSEKHIDSVPVGGESSEDIDFVAERVKKHFVDKFTSSVAEKSKEDLVVIQDQLRREQILLQKENLKEKRQAATLTKEMYDDVQELLRYFGIPYLVSPMEAEAQCAQLELAKLTDGSITDDGDVFLFGGQTVYKNIFNQKNYAELYQSKHLDSVLHLNREKLIALAFLTGSDYTVGLHGIGYVTAMEILHSFSDHNPMKTLSKFKDWLKCLKAGEELANPIIHLKSKLKDVDVPRNFNTQEVWDAYLQPEVDESDERFVWGNPIEVALKDFAKEKLGWLTTHTKEVLDPVLKRWNERKQVQKKIDRYFTPEVKLTGTSFKSKRLLKLLQSRQNQSLGDDELALIADEIDPVSTSNVVEGESSRKHNSVHTFPYFQSETDIYPSSSFDSNTSQYLQSETDFDPFSNYKSKKPRIPRTPPKNKFDVNSTTVSASPEVQAKKVKNLMNAAAEAFKPLPPYIRMNMMNKSIKNRLKGKKARTKRGQRQKVATALLSQAQAIANPDAPKPLVSSESDSE